jgi:hypothetical protein
VYYIKTASSPRWVELRLAKLFPDELGGGGAGGQSAPGGVIARWFAGRGAGGVAPGVTVKPLAKVMAPMTEWALDRAAVMTE